MAAIVKGRGNDGTKIVANSRYVIIQLILSVRQWQEPDIEATDIIEARGPLDCREQ